MIILVDKICVGINKDGDESGIVIRFPVEQQNAGLRSYCEFYLVIYRLSATTLKSLFRQKYVYMPMELVFKIPRQSPVKCDIVI